MCQVANVSGTITSHVRHRPFAQGINVTPTGRFLSALLQVSLVVDGLNNRIPGKPMDLNAETLPEIGLYGS